MALRFSKCQYPGICDSCPKVAKYYVQAGIHRLLLCRDCAITLSIEIHKQVETDRDEVERINSDHMKEVSHDDIRTES